MTVSVRVPQSPKAWGDVVYFGYGIVVGFLGIGIGIFQASFGIGVLGLTLVIFSGAMLTAALRTGRWAVRDAWDVIRGRGRRY